jgi:hypothetical protein
MGDAYHGGDDYSECRTLLGNISSLDIGIFHLVCRVFLLQ